MPDVFPIIAAVVSTIGTLGAAVIGMRRYAKRGNGGQVIAARWREQAELEKARAELLVEERDREKAGRLATEQMLATTRHDLDDCARQLDGVRSDLRALERRRRARTEPTPP